MEKRKEKEKEIVEVEVNKVLNSNTYCTSREIPTEHLLRATGSPKAQFFG